MMDVHNIRDVQAAERIFRKIVHPGLDSLRLVDRNGLPIQSPACSLRQRSFVLSPRGVPTKVTSHMYSGRSSHIARYSDGFSRVGTPEYYGEDSLVMPSNFGTVKSAPQYGMPQRSTPSRAFPSKANRNGFVPKSATVDREINSSLEDKRFSQSAGSRTSRWTMSSQNMRLEKELSDVANSRTLKRNAEILSHRVDRMYFMSGNPMKLKPRYQVDDDELKQLRELAKSRQSSTRQHRRPHFDDNFAIILEDDDQIYDDLANIVHLSSDPHRDPLSTEDKNEEVEPIAPCTSIEEKTTPTEAEAVTSPSIQSDSESENANELLLREIGNEFERGANKCDEVFKDDSEIDIPYVGNRTSNEFAKMSLDNFSEHEISSEGRILKKESRIDETVIVPSDELRALGSDDRLRCLSPESGIEADESDEIESKDSRLSTYRSEGDNLKDKPRPVSRIEILNANLDGAVVNILDILQYESQQKTDKCMLNLWRNFPTRIRLKSTEDKTSCHITGSLKKKHGLRKYVKVNKARLYRKGCGMCGKDKTGNKSRSNVGKCLLQEFPVRKHSPTPVHHRPVECDCRKSYPGAGPNLQVEGTPVPIYELVKSYVEKEMHFKTSCEKDQHS